MLYSNPSSAKRRSAAIKQHYGRAGSESICIIAGTVVHLSKLELFFLHTKEVCSPHSRRICMRSLEVYGLTKRFKKTLALKNVTFSLNPGESLAILGPAGSGKTTLARLIVGLEEPDEGQIVLNGEDITFVPASQRYICLVGNNAYGLLAHMSVFENISMPLQPHFSGKEIKEGMGKQRILSVAQYVHIQHLLERKVGTLSAGERLRVAIARGLVKKPLLSIFDES